MFVLWLVHILLIKINTFFQRKIGCESKWDCEINDQGCVGGKCIPGILHGKVLAVNIIYIYRN
jgi:hypothetical protein